MTKRIRRQRGIFKKIAHLRFPPSAVVRYKNPPPLHKPRRRKRPRRVHRRVTHTRR